MQSLAKRKFPIFWMFHSSSILNQFLENGALELTKVSEDYVCIFNINTCSVLVL